MSGLFQTICRIGIFMICAQAVIHFRPEESYEKYLRLLVSAMVLIQLFLPVGRLLFHGDSGVIEQKSEEFMKQLETEMSAAESRAYESDALLEQMTLEEIRRRMEEQAVEENAGMEGQPAGEDGTAETGRIEAIGRIEVENIRIRPGADIPE